MSPDPRGIIERLMAALYVETQAQLAAKLEIRPQSIISAVNREEIPESWLYRVAYLTGRSIEWLQTGKGPAWHTPVAAEAMAPSYGSGKAASAAFRRVLEAWTELDTEEQAAVERCAQVLRIGDRDIREHLIAQLKLIEEAARWRRTARARRRPRPAS